MKRRIFQGNVILFLLIVGMVFFPVKNFAQTTSPMPLALDAVVLKNGRVIKGEGFPLLAEQTGEKLIIRRTRWESEQSFPKVPKVIRRTRWESEQSFPLQDVHYTVQGYMATRFENGIKIAIEPVYRQREIKPGQILIGMGLAGIAVWRYPEWRDLNKAIKMREYLGKNSSDWKNDRDKERIYTLLSCAGSAALILSGLWGNEWIQLTDGTRFRANLEPYFSTSPGIRICMMKLKMPL